MHSAKTISSGVCITLAVVSLAVTVPAARAGDNEFTATIVYQAPGPIYGLASGEFDAAHAGHEIAFLLGDGTVLELVRQDDAWSTTLLASSTFLIPIRDMTWRPTISIGDVHSGYAGNEIVVQGGRALVFVFFDPDTGWSQEAVVDLSDLFGTDWGARVGDLDPARPGDEIFYIHEGVADFSFGNMYRESGNVWQLGAEFLYSAEVGMDSAIGDINPDHPGNELLIVTEMGPAYELLPPADPADTPWPARLIWDDFDNAGWVVKIADVDPATPRPRGRLWHTLQQSHHALTTQRT